MPRTALLSLLLTLLVTPPAWGTSLPSPLARQGEITVSGAVAGRAWSQAPCKVGDGCSAESGGFWRIDQRDPRVGLAIGGRWFVARGPVGLAVRYRLSERPRPKGPAAIDLPDAFEHHFECRLAARLRAPGARTAWITPELGWDLHTWHAWETTADHMIAEHLIVAHSLGAGLALSVELTPKLGLEARLSLDLLPREGGIDLSEGSVELGLSWSSGPALIRAAAVARAGGIVATRERDGAIHGVRLGVVDVGLEIGAGFRF